MNRALLNGKDVNIDTDFFKELGALPDSFEHLGGEYGTYHRIGFSTEEGRFSAFWDELDNVLRIVCEGLKLVVDEELEMKNLNTLEQRLLRLNYDLDGIRISSMVLKMGVEHPYIRAAFFFK